MPADHARVLGARDDSALGANPPCEARGATGSLLHLITPEYPPQQGGVSGYTYRVASELATRGIRVHVWCRTGGPAPESEGVTVQNDLGTFTRKDLLAVDAKLNSFPAPRHLVVQWVPHGYGYRSMNVEFCRWLRRRATFSGDRIDLMVHEPYLEFRWNSPGQSAAALIHRWMTMLLLSSTRQVWMSIPAWEKRLRPYALGRNVHFDWLPVPSNIPVSADPQKVADLRSRYAAGRPMLIGHFGTYGDLIAHPLKGILSALAEQGSEAAILLMGHGSEEFLRRFEREEPRLKVFACGGLPAEELSHHLSACDLMIQPYPDGVSTRRGSFMAGLSHGRAIVTTIGHLSEPMWRDSAAVAAVPVGDVSGFVESIRRLTSDAAARDRLGRAARELYLERFDLPHVADALLQAPAM